MQDHSHHVQELHEVGFFLILGRSVSLHSCAWCSVRSSLHTSGAHLTAALQGANRCVGVPPPTPPLMGIHHHLFQPSALRSCHVAADAVIQDTPPAFSSPKILVSL